MTEQEPVSGNTASALASIMQVPVEGQRARALVDLRDRKARVVIGGLLAGLGLSLVAILVMRVVQEASRNAGGFSITGDAMAVLFVAGPVFGLGLALALVALIPAGRNADSLTDAAPATPDSDG